MQTRTFQAVNMAEALQLVKTEMGPDAMIISSRKERRKGVFGLFMKPVFRITAAYDPAPQQRSFSVREDVGQKDSTLDEFRKSMLEPLARELKELRERVESLSCREDKPQPEQEFFSPSARLDVTKVFGGSAAPDSEDAPADMREMKKVLLETIKERTVSGVAEPADAPAEGKPVERAADTRSLGAVSAALHDAGIGETAVRALVEKVKATKNQGGEELGLKDRLKSAVESVIKCSGPVRLKKGGRKVVALVGPTGVGKTTTIAKLAAMYTVGRKAKVALITIDTFRVGAVEQLKTYSRIMGVPLEVASTPKELEKALAAHEDKDLVLIDTVGRSPRDHETIEKLRIMLDSGLPIETHLCVAATTRERELNTIIDSFGVLPVSRLLFTKLDESSAFGSLVNLQIERKLPLSYLTKGQRVPEDIEAATGKKIAELILGED